MFHVFSSGTYDVPCRQTVLIFRASKIPANCPIPRINHVRKVDVDVVDLPSGECRLVCSCKLWLRKGVVCRHIRCILDKELEPGESFSCLTMKSCSWDADVTPSFTFPNGQMISLSTIGNYMRHTTMKTRDSLNYLTNKEEGLGQDPLYASLFFAIIVVPMTVLKILAWTAMLVNWMRN